MQSRPATPSAVGVAGAAAAAFGEEHDRQARAARRARTGGPSCGGSARPACRRARCSRTTAPRSARARRRTVAVHACRCRRPARRPASSRSDPRSSAAAAARRSPAARTRRSSRDRTRSSMFSRAVRWPVLRRRATASGRAASSPIAWRSSASARSGADVRRDRSPPRPRVATPAPSAALDAARAGGPRTPCRPPRRATRRTMPLAGAAITCSIFIASITSSCWPARTASPVVDLDR